ncbi:MAG: hypothetical protein KKF44_00490 [Nanoarchaeota archaeon]|nr:hypothetical protein [Nanoarchaeota archaeon]
MSEKGKEAIKNKEEILLDFHSFYAGEFKPAETVGIINKDVSTAKTFRGFHIQKIKSKDLCLRKY